MINWQNVTVKLSTLKPWEHNPRTMTKAQAKRLLKSWNELGQFQTIAIGPGGEVYDGHQRLSALLTAHGAAYQIEARQSDRALTDEERRQLTISANIAAGNWTEEFWTWPETQQYLDDETLNAWRGDVDNLQAMLDESKDEQLSERAEELEPRSMFRVLISVPLDEAIEAREIIEQLASIAGAEIDYGAN